MLWSNYSRTGFPNKCLFLFIYNCAKTIFTAKLPLRCQRKCSEKWSTFPGSVVILCRSLAAVCTSVSKGTGQSNFLGQRDRNSFIVPGQRDNGTSSKSCQGTGPAGTACHDTRQDVGRDSTRFWQSVLSHPAGQKMGQSRKGRSKTWKGRSKNRNGRSKTGNF